MVSRFGRYLEMSELEKDINDAEKEGGWALAEWHPVEETFEQPDSRGNGQIARWTATVFYARFVQVPVVAKPLGMRAR